MTETTNWQAIPRRPRARNWVLAGIATVSVLIIWFYWTVNRRYLQEPEALAEFGFALETNAKTDDEWTEKVYVSDRSIEEVMDVFIYQMARLGYDSDSQTFRNGYKRIEFSRAGWLRAGLVPHRNDPEKSVFYCNETDRFWRRAFIAFNIKN